MAKCNACEGSNTLIFACSGAADVGALADQVARKLTKDGIGKMYCLAGVGGMIEGIVNTTKEADVLIAIDGCTTDCVRHLLEHAGFSGFKHIQLKDLGFMKGQSPATEENIDKAAEMIKDIVRKEKA